VHHLLKVYIAMRYFNDIHYRPCHRLPLYGCTNTRRNYAYRPLIFLIVLKLLDWAVGNILNLTYITKFDIQYKIENYKSTLATRIGEGLNGLYGSIEWTESPVSRVIMSVLSEILGHNATSISTFYWIGVWHLITTW